MSVPPDPPPRKRTMPQGLNPLTMRSKQRLLRARHPPPNAPGLKPPPEDALQDIQDAPFEEVISAPEKGHESEDPKDEESEFDEDEYRVDYSPTELKMHYELIVKKCHGKSDSRVPIVKLGQSALLL